MPFSLAKKYPKAPIRPAWQYVFAAPKPALCYIMPFPLWREATVNNNPYEITRNTEALARKNLTTSLSSVRLDRNRKHFELLAGLGYHDGYCVPYTSMM